MLAQRFGSETRPNAKSETVSGHFHRQSTQHSKQHPSHLLKILKFPFQKCLNPIDSIPQIRGRPFSFIGFPYLIVVEQHLAFPGKQPIGVDIRVSTKKALQKFVTRVVDRVEHVADPGGAGTHVLVDVVLFQTQPFGQYFKAFGKTFVNHVKKYL